MPNERERIGNLVCEFNCDKSSCKSPCSIREQNIDLILSERKAAYEEGKADLIATFPKEPNNANTIDKAKQAAQIEVLESLVSNQSYEQDGKNVHQKLQELKSEAKE